MGTWTLTGNFEELDATPAGTTYVDIKPNVQVVTGSVVFDGVRVPVVNGVFSVVLPTPGSGTLPSAFGFVLSRTRSRSTVRTTWLIPAQTASSTHNLAEFTDTTALEVPPGYDAQLSALDVRVDALEAGGGGGGGGAVASVNAKTGVVVLTASDVGAATTGALSTETSRATTSEGLAAQKTANLSDLASATTARTNLGLGTAATSASTAFEVAGAAATAQSAAATDATTKASAAQAAAIAASAQRASNLSDLASASTARTNLGLGTAATQASSAFDAAGAATSAQSAAATDATNKVATETTRATTAEGLAAQKSNNLSDLANAATARSNLGLGTAAVANKVAAGVAGVLDATDATTTNARTPTAHKTSHATGGGDALVASDIGAAATSHTHAAADVTSGVLSVARVGTGSGSATTYLDGTGAFSTPAGGGSAAVGGIFGDGSDGNVTISTTVTLSADMLYDTLTVSSGGTLKTNGYRIYCKTALVVNSGGIVQRNGNAASGSTGGSALNTGTLAASNAGNSGVTGVGTAQGGVSSAYGGAGGAGGAGASGAGGNGAGVSVPGAQSGSIRALPAAALGTQIGGGLTVLVSGGGAGGNGGGDGTNNSGGAGSGAGVLIINAKAVTNNGTISANGGDGGSPATGNAGGGGGGGGGFVIVNTSTALTGTTPSATGGAGGTKVGTGVNGTAGSTGRVFVNVWQ